MPRLPRLVFPSWTSSSEAPPLLRNPKEGKPIRHALIDSLA